MSTTYIPFSDPRLRSLGFSDAPLDPIEKQEPDLQFAPMSDIQRRSTYQYVVYPEDSRLPIIRSKAFEFSSILFSNISKVRDAKRYTRAVLRTAHRLKFNTPTSSSHTRRLAHSVFEFSRQFSALQKQIKDNTKSKVLSFRYYSWRKYYARNKPQNLAIIRDLSKMVSLAQEHRRELFTLLEEDPNLIEDPIVRACSDRTLHKKKTYQYTVPNPKRDDRQKPLVLKSSRAPLPKEFFRKITSIRRSRAFGYSLRDFQSWSNLQEMQRPNPTARLANSRTWRFNKSLTPYFPYTDFADWAGNNPWHFLYENRSFDCVQRTSIENTEKLRRTFLETLAEDRFLQEV